MLYIVGHFSFYRFFKVESATTSILFILKLFNYVKNDSTIRNNAIMW